MLKWTFRIIYIWIKVSFVIDFLSKFATSSSHLWKGSVEQATNYRSFPLLFFFLNKAESTLQKTVPLEKGLIEKGWVVKRKINLKIGKKESKKEQIRLLNQIKKKDTKMNNQIKKERKKERKKESKKKWSKRNYIYIYTFTYVFIISIRIWRSPVRFGVIDSYQYS